jgi:transcriptional regulator with XRE-family HTH domain
VGEAGWQSNSIPEVEGERDRQTLRAGSRETRYRYLLEQARVNRGVSLEEAAQATRIRRDYLEKLESDDHSTMPEPIYVRGFIKTYANYLGLDGDRLAAQIRFWQERRRRARCRPLWDL